MKIKKQQSGERLEELAITILLAIGGIFTSINYPAKAQIIPDNTLGTENSIVTRDSDIKDIINGGAARGVNLFHSFGKFNVGKNRSVYFSNPIGIENILTRVTGRNVSNILGRLGVNGNANLFLINPNGIYFGKDAILEIRGSFTATTADDIKLGKNGLFSATNLQSSNLLNVQPGALFRNAIKNQIAEIKNEGNLQVDEGKNITFFGANVINIGGLQATGGNVQLTGTENLQVRGNLETGSLLLDTKNFAVGEDDHATIDKATLEGLSGNTNLIFQATDDIDISSLSDRSLNLANGSGSIIFNADVDGDGIGNFQMDIANTIKTNGRDITISGVNLSLGSIDTRLIEILPIIETAEEVIATINVDDGGLIPTDVISGEASFTFTVPENTLTNPIEDVNVRFSASHTYDSALVVSLTSPQGTIVTLFSGVGSGDDNFQDTLLNDLATTSITDGNAPFDGEFKPQGNLADFHGENATGKWTFNVTDTYPPADDGQLYKAGETAPWGTAIGTQLMFTKKIETVVQKELIVDSGNIDLNATDGNINVGNVIANVNQGNGGAIALTTSQGNITTGNLNSSSSSNYGNVGSGGAIALTTSQGNITTGNLNSSSSSNYGNVGSGGAIALTTSQGNITTGQLNSSSNSFSYYGNAGVGGTISLSTSGGNITTENLDSYSYSPNGNARAGGAINLTTSKGNITTGNLNSSSDSFSENAEAGGVIALSTSGGNITTGNLDSYSSSNNGNAEAGGVIALSTSGGSITTGNLDSYSSSNNGNAGNGGAISLSTQGNIQTGDLQSYSDSFSGNAEGGAISLSTQGNITTGDLVSFSHSKLETAGNGGAISLSTQGNITTGDLGSLSYSESGNSGNGGAISLSTQGNITTEGILGSLSYSESGNTGNGGAISLSTQGNIKTGDLWSLSYSPSGNTGNGGAISLYAGGDIEKIETSSVFSSFSSSFSVSLNGTSGQGGNVTLAAKNKISDLDILTLSSSDKSGDVQVKGFGDLFITNTNIITSKQVKIKHPFRPEEITLDLSGIGQSGNVNITSTGNLTFNNSRIESDTRGSDPAGNVIITSFGTVTFNNSKITSNTSSKGKAGNIQIDANDLTLTDTSEISASTTADGKAGDITLNTPTLTVANGAKIFAETTGTGDGGTITINAEKAVNLGIGVQDSSPILSVETSGAGKAGNIIVNTPSLTVSDTARITATATETATNKEGGGSITLNASKMNLAGVVGVFAETQGQAPAGTLQLNPYENQPDLDITLFPNSTISASTTASGKGGDLIITAPENIYIAGKGKLAVESTGSSDAGNIFITTQNFNITDGVKISASTSKTGRGGNINVSANKFTADNGAQLLTTTSGNNQAGNINLEVRDNITLDGINTGLFANTEIGSTGKSGNITIDQEIFIIQNGAGIGVNSRGSGEGGNISIVAGTLRLENQGFISAETASNQGGNINLNIQDFLFLRNNSKITATAGTAGAGGNGGNININAPFIIAFPTENSDITANAFQGNGGRINITSNAIFGLEYRQQLTSESDITASSDFGLAGEVEINTPDVDPTSGLIELPENLVDAASLVGKDICSYEQRAKKSYFTIIGRGGIPAESDELISNSPGMVEWSNRSGKQETMPFVSSKSVVNQEAENMKNPIIQEAQGWIITNDGRVFLTAAAPNVTPQSSGFNHPGCGVFNNK